MSGCYAVLVASSQFPKEPRLCELRCPENDVTGLRDLLTSPTLGLFPPDQTIVLNNLPHHEVLLNINRILKRARKDDLVLLYYSGHGKQDESGRLYLATSDTFFDALESTSVAVESIKSYLENCLSRKIIFILDCCFSGAAGDVFLRSSVDDQLQHVSSGRGIFILTASTGLQVAQEKEGDRYGLLTKHIIEGISEDKADADGDGLVNVDELYRYVHDRVMEESPQEPQKFAFNVQGDLFIARAPAARREERKVRVREMLLDLAARHLLPDSMLSHSFNILGLRVSDMTREARRYDELLDRLLQRKVETGEFIEEWYRIGSPQIIASASRITPPSPDSGDQLSGPMPVYALRRTLPKHPKGVLSLAFSPGGGSLAAGAGDGVVRLWDAASGELKAELTGASGPIWSLCFTADGSKIAAGADKCVHVWQLASGGYERKFSGPRKAVLTLRYSPDDKLLAWAGYDDTIFIWDSEAEELLTLSAHQRVVNTLLFSPDGKRMATAGADRTIKIWDPTDGKVIKTLSGHANSVLCLAFSQDARWLASGGRDGRAKLWDTAGWASSHTLKGHQHSVLSLGFHKESKMLVSGSGDNTMKFWDVEDGEMIRSLETGHIAVHVVALSPVGSMLASGGADQTVRIWEIPVRSHKNVAVN